MRAAMRRAVPAGVISLLLALALTGTAAAQLGPALVVYPSSAQLEHGQTQTFGAFRCPTDPLGVPLLGPDGVPGTADDACSAVLAGWFRTGQIGTIFPASGSTTTLTAALPPGSPLQTGTVVAVSGGASATASVTVTASTNRPPVAIPGGPYNISEGANVGLIGLGSFDPDAPADGIVRYEWDFDYDGVTFHVDALGPTPVFSAAGLDGPSVQTVALRVFDTSNQHGIATTTVTVHNVAPTIDTTPSALTVGGFDIQFVYFPKASDPAGEADPLTWRLVMGPDGITVAPSVGTTQWFLTPAQRGRDHTVVIAVKDDDGAETTQSFTLHADPIALPGGPYRTDEGFAAIFLTGACVGCVRFDWDLDSGVSCGALGNDGVYETPGQNVVFNDPGLDGLTEHKVSLRVTDGSGATHVASACIVVFNASPFFTTTPPSTATVGQPYVYHAEAVDPGGAADLPLTWILLRGPTGMTFDQSGTVRWTPTEEHAGRDHEVELKVSDNDTGPVGFAHQSWTIHVPSDVPFDAFAPDGLSIKLKSNLDRVKVSGTFELAPGQAVDPTTQPVTITLGRPGESAFWPSLGQPLTMFTEVSPGVFSLTDAGRAATGFNSFSIVRDPLDPTRGRFNLVDQDAVLTGSFDEVISELRVGRNVGHVTVGMVENPPGSGNWIPL
jgi:hypothetical protein